MSLNPLSFQNHCRGRWYQIMQVPRQGPTVEPLGHLDGRYCKFKLRKRYDKLLSTSAVR